MNVISKIMSIRYRKEILINNIRFFLCVTLAVFIILSAWCSLAQAESLEESWERALAVSHRLQATHHVTESAQKNLSAAKAERLPGLSLKSGYTILDNEPAFKVNIPMLPFNELPDAEDNSFSYKATMKLPLFTSGQISRNIDVASATLDGARTEETREKSDLKLDVAMAYISVLRAQRAVEVVETSVASLEAYAIDVENIFAKGLVAKNDLLSAQVALADVRQNAVQIRNKLDITRSAYNRLLVRPLTHTVIIDDLSPGFSIREDIEELTRKALKTRPELMVLSQKILSLRQKAASIRAAVLPQVALEGGYTFQENQYLVNEGVWSAMVGLRWDIFDKGISQYKARSLLDQSNALSKLREDLSDGIAMEVRRRWLDVTETRKRISVTQEAVDQAEENFKVAMDRYRSGLGTYTEVLDAETRRSKIRNNYNSAVYDSVLASLYLRHAVGDL
jgi:outer membrane protein